MSELAVTGLMLDVCSIQSNLSVTNHLRTAEKVHYIRVFTTSGFIYNRVNMQVYIVRYVCYVREIIVSRDQHI